MKLAVDPYMLRNTTTLETLPGTVADLGYEYIERETQESDRSRLTGALPRIGSKGPSKFRL